MRGERAPLEGAPTQCRGQRERPLHTGTDSDVPPLPIRITAVGSAHRTALKDSPQEKSPQSFQVQTSRSSRQGCLARLHSLGHPLPDSCPHLLSQAQHPFADFTPLLNACPPQFSPSFCFPSRSLPSFVLNACRISFLFLFRPLLI